MLNHTVSDTECNVRGTGIEHGFLSLGVLSVDGEACSEGRGQHQTSKCKIKCRTVKTSQRPHRVPSSTTRWAPTKDYVVTERWKIHREVDV